MADIQQIRSQVSSACSRYKEDQSKMQSASADMSRFQDEARRAESQLNRVDEEISDIEDEIRGLEAQASRSAGDEGADVSSIYGRISDLRYRKQDLMRESSRLENEMSQARANYQRAHSVYEQAQNDLNKVRAYLEQVRSVMINASQELNRKIAAFGQTTQILNSASGNMFASAAMSQLGRIQSGQNKYQNDLNIAQESIAQINSTLGGSGGGYGSAQSFGGSGGNYGSAHSSSGGNSSSSERQYFDDNGVNYRTGDSLMPNSSYTINSYTYETDSLGRITSAEGTLHLKDRDGRLAIRDSIEDIGKGSERSGDDRGHLIGDQFDGSNGLENMVPQDSTINRVDFKNFENSLAKEVRDNHSVTVRIEPMYSGNSRRPHSIGVLYSIDGDVSVKVFPNE